MDRKWRRIIRRSVPFGPVYDPQNVDEVGADRGLLMNAFMANIEQQFEFLLRGWAGDPDFPEFDDGPDPVMGGDAYPGMLRHANGEKQRLSFERLVHTSDSVYAFVLARTTLKRLSGS